MLDLLICEMIKLKRSKIVMFSVFGALAVPALMLVEALQTHFEHPEQLFTLSDVYGNSLLYAMLLMNMMVYVAITAYLFSREYTEKTLKMILPLPVSRIKFVSGKFLMLYIWTTALTGITWAGILILMGGYHGLFGLTGYTLGVAGGWLLKFWIGSSLIFLTLSPFAYVAEKSKGFVIPVIISSGVVMGSAAVSNQDFGALYPWTAGFFLVSGKIQRTGYPILLAVGILVGVSLIGFFGTYRYFYQEDLR